MQEIEKFLFEASQREEVYGWIERLLCQQEYVRQGRRARGLLRRYIGKMTGLSRAQLTRLVGRNVATGQVGKKAALRHRFPRHYTSADIDTGVARSDPSIMHDRRTAESGRQLGVSETSHSMLLAE